MSHRALVPALLLMAGCSLTPDRPPAPERYDLGPLPTASDSAAPAARIHVSAASWLADTDMRYRLLYEDPRRVGRYSRSRWAAPPAELVRVRLQTLLGGNDGSNAPRRVELHLQSFGQHFPAPGRAEGVIRVRALLPSSGGEPSAVRTFVERRPSPSPDAAGSAAALAEATDALAADLRAWLSRAAGSGR